MYGLNYSTLAILLTLCVPGKKILAVHFKLANCTILLVLFRVSLHCPGRYYITLASLSLLAGCYMTLDAVIAQPERCALPKPAKTMECPETRTSRWFFHETKGCKRSGFCDPEDTSKYDVLNDQNYFLTRETCAEKCQMRESLIYC